MNGTREKEAVKFDPVLMGAILALVSVGLVMVYSASAILAREKLGDSFYFFKRQLLASGLGLLGMAAAMKLGYRRVARLAYPLFLVAVALMILVLVPGVGSAAGGATRWIKLPGFSLQPAEVLKTAWVLYLAYSLAKKQEKVASFSVGFLPHVVLCAGLVFLCMRQPDFGSSVALLFLLFAMLFAAGTKLSFLVGSVLLALPIAYSAVASAPYRMRRIMAFLDPWAHRHDAGYQVAESLMSVGSGGVTGLGLGESRQKLFFLPEAHTDFIFSIVGEEVGLIGVSALVLLYAVIVWRGMRAALASPEPFGTYLGIGLTSLFGFQAVVNMSVAMGLLPTKGLTLPLVSYGGTSMVMILTACGLLLSISAGTQGTVTRRAGARRRGAVSEVGA